jgi:transcriptional regulator with XRE-family HTH domain
LALVTDTKLVKLGHMANRLKELRVKAGLTQDQLAEAAETSGQQISRLERGERKMPPEWMVRLALPLGVRPSALMDPLADGVPGQLVEMIGALDGQTKAAISDLVIRLAGVGKTPDQAGDPGDSLRVGFVPQVSDDASDTIEGDVPRKPKRL